MKLLMENWRGYKEEQEAHELVEQVWSGVFVNETLLLEEQTKLLEAGVLQFFGDTFNFAKQKFEDFETFSREKLMKIINAGYGKILKFLNVGREMFLGAKGDIRKLLGSLFPKPMVRKLQAIIQVLQIPKYLRIGASLIMMLLQKLAKMGITAIIDTLSGGSIRGAQLVKFLKEHYDKLELLMNTLENFLDPTGLADLVKNIGFLKDAKELLDDFASDLRSHGVISELLKRRPSF